MAAGSAGYGAGSNTELRWPHVTATAGSTRRQPPEADFGAPSSDDVDELGRSRGSQMTSHTRSIGHGRRERGGGRWEQHGAPLETFSRLVCQSETVTKPNFRRAARGKFSTKDVVINSLSVRTIDRSFQSAKPTWAN